MTAKDGETLMSSFIELPTESSTESYQLSKEILEELRSIRKENQENYKMLTEELGEMKEKQETQMNIMKNIVEKLEKISDKKKTDDKQDDVESSSDYDMIDEPDTFYKWNKFPVEIKRECIQWMDFETRLNLRCTSTTERGLVDSRKYYEEYVHMADGGIEVETRRDDGLDYFIKDYDKCSHNKWTSSCGSRLMAYILKTTKIDNLFVFLPNGKARSWVSEMIKCQIPPFDVKKIDFYSIQKPLTYFFLDNVKQDTLECIKILGQNGPVGYLNTRAFTKSPTIINVKHLIIMRIFNTDILFDLVEKWIEHDVKVGQKLQCHNNYPRSFSDFDTNFNDRLVERIENGIRIRMNNTSKHIIIRLLPNRKTAKSMSCLVIPSDLQNLEKEEEWYKSSDVSHDDESAEEDEFDDFNHFSDSDDEDFSDEELFDDDEEGSMEQLDFDQDH